MDESNCLILLYLESHIDDEGTIYEDTYLTTNIARYCLNILYKKFGHGKYQKQSSFIAFNEFFTKVYRFVPRYLVWRRYWFMASVNRGIQGLAPNDFPSIEVDGKKRFTPLRTEKGDDKLRKLIKDAEEAEKKYQEENSWRDSGDSWQDEVDELNRAFWRECGEGGSNCESWPGWD